jgi:hypothetical protein
LLSLRGLSDAHCVDLDWQRLGTMVRSRRNYLGIVQGAGGISAATWRKIEKADRPPYRDSTLMAVCRTLGWTADSYRLILEGGEPVEDRTTGARSLEERVAALEAEIEWLKAEVRRLRGDSA